MGCVAQFFYQFHLETFEKKKKVLTQAVASFGDTLLEEHRQLKPLDGSVLSTFDLTFKSSGKSIRVDKNSARVFVGSDTLYRLIPKKQPATKVSKEAASGRKRKSSSASHPPPQPSTSSRRKKPASYAEDESNSDEEIEDNNGHHPPAQPDRISSAILENLPRSGTTAATAGKEAPIQSEPSNALDGDQTDYKDLCRRLTIKVRATAKENFVLQQKNAALGNQLVNLHRDNQRLQLLVREMSQSGTGQRH